MSDEHVCHAEGCHIKVPRRIFMCRSHWFALPRPMRDAVLDAYQPGQEERMDPSDAYLEAARNAVNWLARRG